MTRTKREVILKEIGGRIGEGGFKGAWKKGKELTEDEQRLADLQAAAVWLALLVQGCSPPAAPPSPIVQQYTMEDG